MERKTETEKISGRKPAAGSPGDAVTRHGFNSGILGVPGKGRGFRAPRIPPDELPDEERPGK